MHIIEWIGCKMLLNRILRFVTSTTLGYFWPSPLTMLCSKTLRADIVSLTNTSSPQGESKTCYNGLQHTIPHCTHYPRHFGIPSLSNSQASINSADGRQSPEAKEISVRLTKLGILKAPLMPFPTLLVKSCLTYHVLNHMKRLFWQKCWLQLKMYCIW